MADSVGVIAALVILALLIITVLMTAGIKIILPHERGLYVRMGKFVRILPPGLNFVSPLISSVIRIDMRYKEDRYPQNNLITNDRERIDLVISVIYAVKDPVQAHFKINNYRGMIEYESTTGLATIVSGMKKSEIQGQLSSISSRVEDHVKEEGESVGVDVKSVRVTLEAAR